MTSFFYSQLPPDRPLHFGFLALAQLIPITLAGVIYFSYEKLNRPTLEDRIGRLESHHLKAIESEMKRLKPSRSLLDKDRKTVDSFLRILSKATSWQVKEIKSYNRIVEKQILPIDYRIKIMGDPFNLPVFLAGLHRQPQMCRIEEIDVKMLEDRNAHVSIKVRYFRPDIQSSGWLSDFQLSSAEQIIFRHGWEMWNWKSYKRAEKRILEEINKRYLVVQKDIPSGLIKLRNNGGQFSWNSFRGGKYRPSSP